MLHLKKAASVRCAGKFAKRGLSAVLCAAVLSSALGNSAIAFAAAPSSTVNPACDETYYAILDYYGTLRKGSVVKSYETKGAPSISDFGTYDKISNLTDNTKPSVSGDQVTFRFSGKAPDKFYFEGSTAQPYNDLPWNLAVSYKLNGVPSKVEDIADKTGLVEINVDITPKKNAAGYYKNNLALLGMTAFNADDILSLDAKGAQVQLLGNLRTVMFLAMPSETQHISIKVGSNSFTYPGLTFIAAPATLSQLSKIAELRNTKDKTKDSYDSINKSFDSILDALSGMGENLNSAADGLDGLNEARASAYGGLSNSAKYVDISLANLDSIANSLSPLSGDLSSAGSALTAINSKVNALTNAAVALKPQLAACRSGISALQTDMNRLAQLSGQLESHGGDVSKLSQSFQKDTDSLNSDLKGLTSNLNTLNSTLSYLKSSKALSPISEISVNGIPIPSDPAKAKALINSLGSAYDGYYSQAKALHDKYKATDAGKNDADDSGFPAYLKSSADSLYNLWQAEQQAGGKDGFDSALGQANQIHSAYKQTPAGRSDTSDSHFTDFVAAYLVTQLHYPQQKAAAVAAQMAALLKAEQQAGGEDALNSMLSQANGLYNAYKQTSAGKNDTNNTGLKPYMENQLSHLAEVYVMGAETDTLGGKTGLTQMIMQASAANKTIEQVNSQISSVNSLINGLAGPTASVTSSLSSLCTTLGSGGLGGDLSKMNSLLSGLQSILNAHKGNAAALANDTNRIGSVLADMTKSADSAISQLQALQSTVDQYIPKAQQTLADCTKAASSTSSGIRSMTSALRSIQSIATANSSKINDGTEKALGGLSKTLRGSSKAFNQVDNIRGSKNTIQDLINGEFNSSTSGLNNIFNMDPNAKPVSMTSSQNKSPQSVQMILRTQEIDKNTAKKNAAPQAAPKNTTFWGRVGGLFVGMWDAITGVFKHK